MSIQNENKQLLTKSDITVLKQLLKQEYKTNETSNDLKTKDKVKVLCEKFMVSSFEEIIRIIDFYNLFEINITDEYKLHIEKYSIDKISMRMCLRNLMLHFAINAPELLCSFCDNSKNFTMKDDKNDILENIKQIQNDNDCIRIIDYMNSFIALFNGKHNFGQIFKLVFTIDDVDFNSDAEIIAKYFNSLTYKYFFIVRAIIGELFPIKTTRRLSQEEKEIVRFLLHKGDEIEYMKKFDIQPIIFKDKLKMILDVYQADNLQEMLILASLELYLRESSLAYNCVFLHIRGLGLLSVYNDKLKNDKNFKNCNLKNLFTELERKMNKKIFNTDLAKVICENEDDLCDYSFSINGKVDSFIEWIDTNVMKLDEILELQHLIYKIEDTLTNENLLCK